MEDTSNPYSGPVRFMNCQKPAAPAGLTTWLNPLSMTARYLKSEGTPSSSKMGSITGNHRAARFRYNMVELCRYVFTISSRSSASTTPNRSNGTGSPNSAKSWGTSGEITGECCLGATSKSGTLLAFEGAIHQAPEANNTRPIPRACRRGIQVIFMTGEVLPARGRRNLMRFRLPTAPGPQS